MGDGRIWHVWLFKSLRLLGCECVQGLNFTSNSTHDVLRILSIELFICLFVHDFLFLSFFPFVFDCAFVHHCGDDNNNNNDFFLTMDFSMVLEKRTFCIAVHWMDGMHAFYSTLAFMMITD